MAKLNPKDGGGIALSKYKKGTVKVSQGTIDTIKKLGMTGTLNKLRSTGANSSSPQFYEGAVRMYGQKRVDAAIKRNEKADASAATARKKAATGITRKSAVAKSTAANKPRGAAPKKVVTGVTKAAAMKKAVAATKATPASRMRRTGRGN